MATYDEITSMRDHSLLRPFLTDQEIDDGCRLAHKYRVATVCVRPSDVQRAKEILRASPVLMTTVIGFPHGSTTTRIKVMEAEHAIADGAREVDVVLNAGKLKSGSHRYVEQDIKAVVELAHSKHVAVKVIFENCYLTDQEKLRCVGSASNLALISRRHQPVLALKVPRTAISP